MIHPLPHSFYLPAGEIFIPSDIPCRMMVIRLWKIFLLSILLVVCTLAQQMRAADLLGVSNDAEVRSDAVVGSVTANTMIVGGSGSPVTDRAAIFVMQLPSLGAVSNPFTSAIFRFHLVSKTGTPLNVDLYGLGSRSSATVLVSDYYGQNSATDASDATLLQSDILSSATATGVISTQSSGSTALKNYLNAQYASGAGAGKYVFLRLSTIAAPGGNNRYTVTASNGGVAGNQDTRPKIIYNLPTGYTRPFIWVRDSEKAGILAKISGNAWATSVYNGMISRVATDVASHQSNRDTFLRQLPVEWSLATPKFKTIPAFVESTVRFPAESKFNDALDCAVLFYLTGDAKYARCAGDILHNAVKTLLPVTASSSTGNGGWIFQTDFLKEARVTGTQLPMVYDFLYSWLQSNQVYDVKTASMVNFNFTNAQSVFRKYYQLARDHGQKDSNWSALMATTMLNNLLALDSSTERDAAIQIYLTTGSSRQASLQYDYRHYTTAGNIWPESLQYAGAVGSIRSAHMVLLERVNPQLNLFDVYPNMPLSLPRISYLRYPNGEQISFGDGHREAGGQPYFQYELVYQHALARGRTKLTTLFGSLINGGVAAGDYNRSTLRNYSQLGSQNEVLQLLWQAPTLSESPVTPELPRTDTLPFAGVSLQRNPAPSNNSSYGLMCFVGGSGFVHSHASGMSMELYGMGEVMGAKSGRDDYGSTLHEKYYRLFAANNTVIVNGGSMGDGGWADIEINTVQNVAMEPQPFAAAVSPDFSFTCSSFADNRGTLADATQQRTLAIVRTSPTSGFYVDLFRSKSTVTNRTATTLNGTVTNQYHDYIYRNIGETNVDLRADGVTLPLTSQTNRFQNDIGDAYDQPGWRYFSNTTVSYPTSQSVRAQFVATVGGTARYMDLHMPAVASREYAKVTSPAIVDAPSPYNGRSAPAVVVRQIGEAWNKAFAAVYEPHFGSTGNTVQNVTQLLRSGVVVGVKVESKVGLQNVVHYILSHATSSETFTDASTGLSFTGRFGIVADFGDGNATLYLGEGSALAYRGNTLSTVSGSNSQAQARFAYGQTPIVTSNSAVTVVPAPPPAGYSWVPTAAGTSYVWNQSANWNPAVIPNGTGVIAYKNGNILGDQTVSIPSSITLGELVIGDSNGAQSTLIQKSATGSVIFDQTENGMAYLTRTAAGTGTVTFHDQLNLALQDDITVRLAGGSASSTLAINGVISGAGKSLTKSSDGLTLMLAGANTYSGPTRVLGGILSLNHSLAIQDSVLDTTSSILGNASNGLRVSVPSLTLGGLSGSKNIASLFTTTAGGYSGLTALTIDSAVDSEYSGAIADGTPGLTLTKQGAGTQRLSGNNTYTGSTTISANAGVLEIFGEGKLGNGSYGGILSVGNGSTFFFNSSASQTLSVISGAGSLIKDTGANALTLTAANPLFTGSVAIHSGALVLGNANALSGIASLNLTDTSELKTSVQNASINASIVLAGTPTIHAPDFGTGSTTSTMTIGGVMSGVADLTLSSTSAVASNSQQTILLNTQSTYNGKTIIHPSQNDANLIVKLGVDNALPTNSVLAVNGSAGGGTGRAARVDLNGFDQTIGGLQNTPASLRSQQVLNSSGSPSTLTIQNTGTHVFSGNLQGAKLSVTKAGTGTQTFSGSNNYAGATTVNAGKLYGATGGNAGNSTVIMNSSQATFGVSVTNVSQTWTCAALTTAAAGKLEFNFGSLSPGIISPLTVSGVANFSITPTVSVVSNSGIALGTYPLMTWSSITGSAPSSVSVVQSNGTNGLAEGTTASLSVTGNTLSLVISGVPTSVKANNTNNLNIGSSWVGAVLPNASSTVVWNSTVTAANTTVLGADLTWAGITITNPTGAVTINAGNTLTIGANVTDINMSASFVNLTMNCAIMLDDANVWNVGPSRVLTMGGVVAGDFSVSKEGAGTLIMTGVNTYTGDTILGSNAGIWEIGVAGKIGNGSYAGAVEIGSGSTFRYNSTSAQSLNGELRGTGSLVKNASSTLTLASANSDFTGDIVINAGLLSLSHVSALGGASSLTIAGGASLTSQTSGINTTTPITLGTAGVTSTISVGRNISAQGTWTFAGAISGSGNLTFTTPNVVSGGNMQTVFLGATNTYAGTTTITVGNTNNSYTVKALVASALPETTVLHLNGGNGAGSGRSVNFDMNSFDQALAGLSNTTGLTSRSQRILNSGNEAVTLTINNASDYNFSGNINGTGMDLVKLGAGTQILSAANLFTGSTTISEGVLSLGHSLALQQSALNALDSIPGDATNGLKITVTTLTLGGLSGDQPLASLFTTNAGGYANLTSLALNPPSGRIHEYSGIIANGASSMSLIKSGAGTQVLSGPNVYSGTTSILAGTLVLGGDQVIPNGSAISIADATLDAGSFTNTLGTLDLTGGATIHFGTGGTLTFAASNSIDWAGGTLKIEGEFVPGSSVRFGTSSAALTAAQVALISISGYHHIGINSSGYLTAWPTYETWAAVNAPTTPANADEDHDGVANALEYVLGGSIASNDAPNLPTISTNGGNMQFHFQRSQASIDGATTLVIEVSDDLFTWNQLPSPYSVPDDAAGFVPSGVTVEKNVPAFGFDTVTLRVPLAGKAKQYVRLKVSR
jgi:autotransporter-associated beta strand protein